MKELFLRKYRIIKLLGEGASGSVYLVKNLHLNRQEALKICTDTKENKQILSEEAKVLKQLKHPMLPVVYDLFEEDGLLCMVMEYVEGITLEIYLQQFGRIEEEKAISFAVSLSEVLEYLHKQKPEIIYRDLKPSNIMMLPDGTLKLIDLGAAYAAVHNQSKQGLLMGTPGYSPPEQWNGGCICKESDIYALGMVLHEMLTGFRPISACQERRPAREYDRSISRSLEQIIMKCTEERVEKRYHSMEQLRCDLQTCRAGEQLRERILKRKQWGGLLLWMIVGMRTLLPFLFGVNAEKFPFPYLKDSLGLLAIAVGYQLIFLRRKNREMTHRLEKTLFLTEKKFPGLYVGILIGILLMESSLHGQAGVGVTAAGKAEDLWVDMRDEKGRKCLTQEDFVYQIGDKMWLELTSEYLPTGVSALKLIAMGEDNTVYESRLFLVENN